MPSKPVATTNSIFLFTCLTTFKLRSPLGTTELTLERLSNFFLIYNIECYLSLNIFTKGKECIIIRKYFELISSHICTIFS